MFKKHILILMAMVFCSAGCSENRPHESVAGIKELGSPAGMIVYLQRKNLPALKSVEVWENEYGPGLKLVTEHYEVFTTLLEPLMLSQVPGFVESCYRGYSDQLPRPVETSAKFPIYLFALREQWEGFTDSFAGREAPLYRRIKMGAYYLNDTCVAYNIGRERTFSALGHEGWHQFNKRHFTFRLPSWLDEGVAMLFEASRYDRGFFYFEPDNNLQRLGALKKAMTRNEMIPLEKLVTMNPGEFFTAGGAGVLENGTDEFGRLMAFYSQSYALVRFLREDDYGKRLVNYHRLVLGGLVGQWELDEPYKTMAADRNVPLTAQWNNVVGLQLFRRYIGGDFFTLENEYRAFCGKLVYHIHFK